jgi:transglutaminase-like putative cysteine protease
MADVIFLSRQLLIGLLALYASVILLHFSRLPLWVFGVCVLVFIWRINILREKWHPPKKLGKLLLVGIVAALLFFEYEQWFSVEPMLTLLLLALTLKLLEIRHQRDYLLILFLSYFVIACGFLFDQSVLHSVFSLCVVIINTFVLLQLYSVNVSFKKRLRLTLAMLSQSIVLAVVMMLVFPRINPLWSVPLQSDQAMVGMVDSMSPGDFSQLIRSDRLALRISFNKQLIDRNYMYWRGLVFDDFDGRRWQRSAPVSVTRVDPRASVRPLLTEKEKKPKNVSAVEYEVLMEASGNSWLYGVPIVEVNTTASPLIYTPQQEVLLKQPVNQRIKYSATSYLGAQLSTVDLSNREYLQYTALDSNYNPQAQKTARRWRQQAGSHAAFIKKVLSFYRSDFTYTLSPPKLGLHTVDEFLFSTQQGFCEHFASSFTVLMRSVGIPARVVVGYQGGEWNAKNNYLQVYQRDAHAWSEVWLQGQGWRRVDPTAAVAEVRIEQGVGAALPQAERQLLANRAMRFQWLSQLRDQWELIDYRWQSWVLDYDSSQQKSLLKQYLGDITPIKLAAVVLIPLLLVIILISLNLFRSSFKSIAKEKKVYRLLQKKLHSLGVQPESGESIACYCDRVVERHPRLKQPLAVIKTQLETVFYNVDGLSDSDSKRLLLSVKQSIRKIV